MKSGGDIENELDQDLSVGEPFGEELIMNRILEFSVKKGYSVALWRLPDQNTIRLMVDVDGYESLEEIDLEEMEKGFLFSPYESGAYPQVFIRKHIYFDSEIKTPDISFDVEQDVLNELNTVLADTNHTTSKPTVSNSDLYHSERDSVNDTLEDEYICTVENSIQSIQSGIIDKVVPSKIKSVHLDDEFDIIDNFYKLSSAYSKSFVYFISVPGIGSWMGASPETLIEIEDGKKFRTISLAGTQEAHPSVQPGSVAWTQKEIEEQAMVSRYVINCFKQIRLREFVEKGPKTVAAGKLLHLKTVFEVDMEETGFHNLGTVMLKLLHPTSAVCGMPREAANNFLKSVEKHDRKYFCGYLGPVDNSQNTHLYVNLRCMELFKNEAVLYAGAGITEDSIPEKEWEETDIKCNTLLDVITGE